MNRYRYDRKESNRRLRDENIRIAEERGRKELADEKKGINLNLTVLQIKKSLRRNHAKKNERKLGKARTG